MFTRPAAARFRPVEKMLDRRSASSKWLTTCGACCDAQMSETGWPGFLRGNGAIWEMTGFARNWINGRGRVSCVGRGKLIAHGTTTSPIFDRRQVYRETFGGATKSISCRVFFNRSHISNEASGLLKATITTESSGISLTLMMGHSANRVPCFSGSSST